MDLLYTAAGLVLVQDLYVSIPETILLSIARYTSGTAVSLLCTFTVGRWRAKISS
jgi:hypothetical protein